MGLLLTGMALGATFCGGAAAAGIVAVPTRQPIYVDGQQVKMEAYNICLLYTSPSPRDTR